LPNLLPSTLNLLQLVRIFLFIHTISPSLPQEEAAFHKSMNDKKRRARKNTNKSPLVDSGILQQAATSGAIKVTGPASRRKMKIPAPHYFNFHKPGQIHKKSALEAVVPQEEREFAKVVGKVIELKL